MLVLSRKTGERVIIGDGERTITVAVLGNDRGEIRLGIEAPNDISVHRKEIYDRIKACQDGNQSIRGAL